MQSSLLTYDTFAKNKKGEKCIFPSETLFIILLLSTEYHQ